VHVLVPERIALVVEVRGGRLVLELGRHALRDRVQILERCRPVGQRKVPPKPVRHLDRVPQCIRIGPDRRRPVAA